jgi:uncharacterized protein (TIGR00297 family)
MPGPQFSQFLIGGLLGLLVAAFSYAVRFLTLSGSIATFFLALVVYGCGGWVWTVPIVTFFVTSSVLSKIGRRKKAEYDQLFEKAGARDWAQVAANGGIAGVFALLTLVVPEGQLYPVYLGAVAAAAADTWGTEIGVLSKQRVFSVVTFGQVPAGTSGGVTVAGTLGGAVGAVCVALSGFAWYGDIMTAFLVVIAGIVGSVADSVIGGTLQARFRCTECGRMTERTEHCSRACLHVGGVRWLRNDAVNVLCTLVGGLIIWGIRYL